MANDRIFIFGAGYSCRAFAAQASGRPVSIAGTTRSPDNFAVLQGVGIEPHLYGGQSLAPEAIAQLVASDVVVASIAPGEAGDPAIETLRSAAGIGARPDFIAYLSTVGVYGDQDGAWIDEGAACNPVSARSRMRVEAERAWLAYGREASVPVAILRLSGIYGPGRNAFVNLEDGTARRLVKPGQVFNRIHVDDIAGALWHLIDSRLGGIFNVTDDLPAPPQDVVAYAARRMGVEPPPEIPFDTAVLTPMARSFYGENKRVSNAALKATGYVFRHPDYRSALDAMWADGSWRGAGRQDLRSPIRAS